VVSLLVHGDVVAHQVPQPVSAVFCVVLDISITTETESLLVEHKTIFMSGHFLERPASKDFEEIKALGWAACAVGVSGTDRVLRLCQSKVEPLSFRHHRRLAQRRQPGVWHCRGSTRVICAVSWDGWLWAAENNFLNSLS